MHCILKNAPLPTTLPVSYAAATSSSVSVSCNSVSALDWGILHHLHCFLHTQPSHALRVFLSATSESLPSGSWEPVSQDPTPPTEQQLLLAVRERKTEEAWKLFTILKKKGTLASQEGLSRLVAQLSHQGTPTSLARAQQLVAFLQERDQFELLDRDAVGLLIVAMAKAGASRYALSVLRIMLRNRLYPSVRVWSAVVSKLGKQLDEVPTALELFDEVCGFLTTEKKLVAGSSVDAQSSPQVPNLARVSSPLNKNEERELRGNVQEMMPDTGAFNAVLNACANGGLVEQAQLLLGQMPLFGVLPDVLTFNILIKLYARADNVNELEKVLGLMVEAGVEPDPSTFSSLIAAYVGLGDLQKAEKLVQKLQRGPSDQQDNPSQEQERKDDEQEAGTTRNLVNRTEAGRHSVATTLPIEMNFSAENQDLSECGSGPTATEAKLEDCWRKWGEKFKPDARMYTTLMKGYMRQGRLEDAIQLLGAMQHQQDPRSLPNEVTYTTAIKACVTMGLMDEAGTILQDMAAQKIVANTVTYNTLLQGYCKDSTDIDKAHSLLEDMKKLGVPLDVVTYNTVINGCIEADDNFRALALFREMRGVGMAPSKVSYTTLMKAFGKTGQTSFVSKVFEEMCMDPRVKVDVIAWNTLIDSYCKAGLMDDAKKYFNLMKDQGECPTAATYGTMVKGFVKIGETGEVLLLWNEIREKTQQKVSRIKQFKPDWALMDSLVDAFLRVGYFQKALEVVSCMEEQGISADKAKFKRMFIELFSNLYTSKHVSQRRRDRSAVRRRAFEAFKFWLGLPNKYYETDWSP